MWSPAEFLWSRSGIPTPTSITGWSGHGTEETAYRQLMGCGVYRTRMWEDSFKEWRTNNTAWQLYYIFKANGYSLLSLWRFSLGTILDGIYPTSMMDIPIGQQSVIYNGEIYNQELTEVAELITSPEAIKIIWQSLFWRKLFISGFVLCTQTVKDPQRRQIEN